MRFRRQETVKFSSGSTNERWPFQPRYDIVLLMPTNVNRKTSRRSTRVSTSPAAIVRDDLRIPTRFRGDPAIWAAWLYYHDNLTQAEIGLAMGVSRATVNAYIAEARERGVVSVKVDPSWMQTLEISESVTQKFGLKSSIVIPATKSAPMTDTLAERIGRAGAELLASNLEEGDVVGVAWGRTVLALAQAIKDPLINDLTVTQLTGGTTSTFDFSPEFCASLIAERLNARCLQVTAPAIVSSSEVRDVLMREPIVQEQFATLASVDKVVFGICTTLPDSLIFTSGLLTQDNLPTGPSGPAVAAIAGRCVAPDGSAIAGSHDDRVIGLPLDDLRKVKMRIAVAGGLDKIEAIIATLRGGYATTLVTDEDTALALLQHS